MLESRQNDGISDDPSGYNYGYNDQDLNTPTPAMNTPVYATPTASGTLGGSINGGPGSSTGGNGGSTGGVSGNNNGGSDNGQSGTVSFGGSSASSSGGPTTIGGVNSAPGQSSTTSSTSSLVIATSLTASVTGGTTPTNTPLSSPATVSGSGSSNFETNGNSNSQNGLGIGLGIGIPIGVIVIGALLYYFCVSKARRTEVPAAAIGAESVAAESVAAGALEAGTLATTEEGYGYARTNHSNTGWVTGTAGNFAHDSPDFPPRISGDRLEGIGKFPEEEIPGVPYSPIHAMAPHNTAAGAANEMAVLSAGGSTGVEYAHKLLSDNGVLASSNDAAAFSAAIPAGDGNTVSEAVGGGAGAGLAAVKTNDTGASVEVIGAAGSKLGIAAAAVGGAALLAGSAVAGAALVDVEKRKVTTTTTTTTTATVTKLHHIDAAATTEGFESEANISGEGSMLGVATSAAVHGGRAAAMASLGERSEETEVITITKRIRKEEVLGEVEQDFTVEDSLGNVVVEKRDHDEVIENVTETILYTDEKTKSNESDAVEAGEEVLVASIGASAGKESKETTNTTATTVSVVELNRMDAEEANSSLRPLVIPTHDGYASGISEVMSMYHADENRTSVVTVDDGQALQVNDMQRRADIIGEADVSDAILTGLVEESTSKKSDGAGVLAAARAIPPRESTDSMLSPVRDSLDSVGSRSSHETRYSTSYIRAGSADIKSRAVPIKKVGDFQGVPDEFYDVPDLTTYVPPPPNTHVVNYPYTGIRPDELTLEKGDIVGIELKFDDGWARGQLVSKAHKRGLFPLTVITPNKSGPSQLVAQDSSHKSYFVPKRSSDGSGGSSSVSGFTSLVPERVSSLPKTQELRASEEARSVSAIRAKFDKQ